MKKLGILAVLFLMLSSSTMPVNGPIKLALVKYNGGGDWYAVVNALENLAAFANQELRMNIDPEYGTVDVGSADVFNYPFLFMTGHGNVVFSESEAENLRTYLMGGGFLFIDDDFGMDDFVRPAIQKVFPDRKLTELPYEHPLFHQKYNFPKGMPKVHEHDGKAPQTFGIFVEDRLVLVYAKDSNISDGWEDRSVHHDSEEVRQAALRMGSNMLQFVFGGQ